VNIAYESYNPDYKLDFKYVQPILAAVQNKYKVEVIKYEIPIHIYKASTKYNLYNTIFKGWTYEITTNDIYLSNINDPLELQLLENRYPQCLLKANDVLQVNLLITTLGR
jgi:hypothetical protein